MLRPAIAIAALTLLAGCSAISALSDATTPLEVYELRAEHAGVVASGAPLARDIIVELPTTAGALDTDRIMIRPNAFQAQYLPEARWGEPTPVMVQTLMVRALENTNALRYVARRPLGPGGDFAIVTELVDFQAEQPDANAAPVVNLRMSVRILRESDTRIIASRTFTASAEAASTDTLVLVAAFDRAAASLMDEFTAWTLASLGARVAAR